MKLTEQIHRIQEVMGITEIRDKFLKFLIDDNPNVPEYVIKDLFYPSFKDNPQSIYNDNNDWYDVLQEWEWELHKDVRITMDMFDEHSKNRFRERLESEEDIHVPNDKKRHAKQRELILQRGIPQEPIIIGHSEDEPGKYGMWEGWHRLTQLFKIYPEGFIYPNVYIGSTH